MAGAGSVDALSLPSLVGTEDALLILWYLYSLDTQIERGRSGGVNVTRMVLSTSFSAFFTFPLFSLSLISASRARSRQPCVKSGASQVDGGLQGGCFETALLTWLDKTRVIEFHHVTDARVAGWCLLSPMRRAVLHRGSSKELLLAA